MRWHRGEDNFTVFATGRYCTWRIRKHVHDTETFFILASRPVVCAHTFFRSQKFGDPNEARQCAEDFEEMLTSS
jgi:hypothetical protein